MTIEPSPVATLAPETTPAPIDTPTATPIPPTPTPEVVIVPPTPVPLSYEEAWREIQRHRVVFDTARTYTTDGSQLWWYDPANQQHVVLGSFAGDFQVQAQFILAGKDVMALEVPYQINQSYGLTALSSALVQRMHDAGYTDWVEAYVIVEPDVQPRP